MTADPPPLAVVVKGWPRLSETFIAQELVALEAAGHRFEIWSLRHPTDARTHPLHHRLRARVRYLPEYLHDEKPRVIRAWAQARRLPGFGRAVALWRRDFARDRSRNRLRRFGQACVMATEMPVQTRAIYAHFLHTPASVARYAAAMRGCAWAFSAHAKDIWTTPDWELREKLGDDPCAARFGVTCTRFGAEHLRDLAAEPARISLLYHGLDLSRFPPPPQRDTRAPSGRFHMLSVGRLVEKKGFDRLIEALALLPDTLDWHWTHIGGGGLKTALDTRAGELGLGARLTWRGACDQPQVIEAMRGADLFVLPSRIAADGDRDGLPNVLMEAASQGLPILSTSVSAIPEFIENGKHGILVRDTPEALAEAMTQIAAHPDAARARAAAALQRLKADFTMEPGIERLSDLLSGLCDAQA